MGKNINSHIQMPKSILRKFEDDTNHIYYYDVNIGKIDRSTPKSWNTELDYYDENTEKFLNKNIETPFLKVVSFIEKNIDKLPFSIPDSCFKDIKSYFNALIARSPQLFKEAMDNSDFAKILLDEQSQHILTLFSALEEIEKKDMFGDFSFTFLQNKTEMPFVLPIMGMYSYAKADTGERKIILPITPKIAILMVENKFLNEHTHADGTKVLYEVNDTSLVYSYNCYAVKYQQHLKYGSVVANNKQLLIDIKNELEK